MQEKTKEMGMALTNNMEEYRTQKKAREKRLMAYAEEIQKKYDVATIAHLTCVCAGKDSIRQALSDMKAENAAGYSRYYRNIPSQYCAF